MPRLPHVSQSAGLGIALQSPLAGVSFVVVVVAFHLKSGSEGRGHIHPGRQAVVRGPRTHFLLHAGSMEALRTPNKLNQEPDTPGFKPQFNLVLAVCSWASYLTSLNPGLHICENTVPTSQVC